MPTLFSMMNETGNRNRILEISKLRIWFRLVHFWRFLRPVFSASRVQHISDMHSKFALRAHLLCGSMVDILSATAEIRRGKKKEERKKKPQDENVISASAKQGGHNNEATTAAKYNGLPITMYGHNKRAV